MDRNQAHAPILPSGGLCPSSPARSARCAVTNRALCFSSRFCCIICLRISRSIMVIGWFISLRRRSGTMNKFGLPFTQSHRDKQKLKTPIGWCLLGASAVGVFISSLRQGGI